MAKAPTPSTKKPTEDADKYRAPALDKGLDILELLASADVSMSQADISKALGRTPNEIYRMLDRLVSRDYVRRTRDDRYELSLKLFELAHKKPPIHRLVSQAMPIMRQFALDSEQACHLVIRDRNILVVVAKVDGPGYWNISMSVGARLDLVDTGSGHIFLAFCSDEERRILMEEHKAELTDDLLETLAAVRKNGYENMPSLQINGVTNLSLPIFGPLGSVIGVLTCPFSERLDKPSAPKRDMTLAMLRNAAKQIIRHTTPLPTPQG